MNNLLPKVVTIELVKTNEPIFVTLKITLFIEETLTAHPLVTPFGKDLFLYKMITPPANTHVC